jgi:hypothetical protein
MRITVDHRARYTFDAAQPRLVLMLRLNPQDGHDQTVCNWHVGVDCDARMRETRDGFGNRVTMLYAPGPIDAVEVHVTGEVLTADGNGIVGGAWEPLPPVLFQRASPLALAAPAILELAAGLAEHDAIERLHLLNLGVRDRAAETRSAGDLAHDLIAAARSLGVPARYIAGFRAAEGRTQPHAWAEAHVDGLGWIALDPSRGVCADDSYVRVAVGLDAATAAPIAGPRLVAEPPAAMRQSQG